MLKHMWKGFFKNRSFVVVFLFFTINMTLDASQERVGLCITATGKYNVLASQLIRSARDFFLKDCDVTYFVFADGEIELANDVKVIYQKRLGWPYDTLMRFEIYLNNKEMFENCEYLFAVDADMLFVSDVGEEILGDLVGTIHPGYYNTQTRPYENRRKSTACIKKKEGTNYFAGGFYGGKKEAFLQLLLETSTNVQKDLTNKFIAVWHDESHLNRYFVDHPPTIKLNPSYCYPENWNIPFPKKLLALDKNHIEIRK